MAENVETTDLLHPEVLSVKQLIHIFKERQIDVKNLESLDKHVLVDLFYETVIPKPQRTYRRNRRGQAMTKLQIMMSKRKRTHQQMQDKSYTIGSMGTNNGIGKTEISCDFKSGRIAATGDRLKPPPSAINGSNRVISLNSRANDASVGKATASQESCSRSGVVKLTSRSSSSSSMSHLNIQTFKPKTSQDSNGCRQSTKDLNTSSSPAETEIKPQVAARKIKLNRRSLTKVASDNQPAPEREKPESLTEKTDILKKEDVLNEETVKRFKKVAVKWP